MRFLLESDAWEPRLSLKGAVEGQGNPVLLAQGL